MNFRPSRRPPPEVTLTPLIDVVFLLLIFFMVSSHFERQTRLEIALPEAVGEQEQEPDRRVLDLTIDRQGRYFVNQRQVVNTTMETLKQALAKAVGAQRDLPVLISADAQTPHQAVITAMDAASQLGLVHIVFAAAEAGSGP